ncbi:uncharacterized protein EHS24_001033 [Apiotrichum porosum]|uniref:RRM domain-containing protein n=1 Tax=Apiotrichum porosum TaxID=105984 RepID=A0A427YBM8_9TREE|nr:uncharacterized protein EHS24_001033 [Apiotrichum porosum]RSH88488.1 hypothetical protein EHS24_001033 [Apiotrichum porosum]
MAEQGYTPEEHAAAWAAYYAQQGYTPDQIAAMTSGSTGNQAVEDTSSSFQPSASGHYATPGYDENGYKIQPAVSTSAVTMASGSGSGSGSSRKKPALLDAELLLKQTAVYVPGGGDRDKMSKSTGKQKSAPPKPPARETVIRKAAGKTWEDPTLLEWDPKWYRLFVGDVSNDVSERTLDEAFGKYKTYCKCKVVRDHLSQKAKYGFIAFTDPEDFLRAWKEMDGKYVGNRPIRLSKIKDDKYGGIQSTSVSQRKAKELDKLRKNHGKPLNGRPTPW